MFSGQTNSAEPFRKEVYGTVIVYYCVGARFGQIAPVVTILLVVLFVDEL